MKLVGCYYINNDKTRFNQYVDTADYLLIAKDNGDTFKVPAGHEGFTHIPIKPSECNDLIKLLETLRDNFTDKEVEDFYYQLGEGIVVKNEE